MFRLEIASVTFGQQIVTLENILFPTLLLFLHRDDDGVHGHDDDRDDDALRIRKFHT